MHGPPVGIQKQRYQEGIAVEYRANKENTLIDHQLREIALQDGSHLSQMFGGILLHAFKRIFPAHRLVLVDTEGMVRQEFHALDHLVVLEMFTEGMEVFREIAQTRNDDAAHPEGTAIFFEPGSSTQSLFVGTTRDMLVTFRIDFLHVEEHQVGEGKKFFDVLVPDTAIGIDANVDTCLLELTEEWHEGFSLHGGFTAGEGDAATLTEERLHADGLVEDILRISSLALAYRVDCVGIGAIETFEGTTLEEDDITETGTIEGTHGLIGMYFDQLVHVLKIGWGTAVPMVGITRDGRTRLHGKKGDGETH